MQKKEPEPKEKSANIDFMILSDLLAEVVKAECVEYYNWKIFEHVLVRYANSSSAYLRKIAMWLLFKSHCKKKMI